MDIKAAVDELVRLRLVHEIHTSERKSFRGCRRRWNWIFREFYYPKVTAKPLEFGVAFHDAMECLYNPDTWSMPREVVLNSAIQTFINKCNAQRDKYLELREQYVLETTEAEEDYDERIELGKGMLKFYSESIMPIWDKGWTPRYVEIEFLAPIQNPDTDAYIFCNCNTCKRTVELVIETDPEGVDQLSETANVILKTRGLPVALAGRIDMIAQDSQGHLWIVDWKTAAQLAKERGDEFLELDDQISSYVMALRRKLGIDIKGFLYVEMKKAVPERPERNKTVRLGRSFSVSKSQATTYDLYLDTVKTEDTAAYEAGLYDDFLTFLKEEGSPFFWRYQIRKNSDELEQIERVLYEEALDMTDPDLRIYPNAGRFNCGFCAFRQPCLELNRRGDYHFILDEQFERRKQHYWVKELSTDKQGGE